MSNGKNKINFSKSSFLSRWKSLTMVRFPNRNRVQIKKQYLVYDFEMFASNYVQIEEIFSRMPRDKKTMVLENSNNKGQMLVETKISWNHENMKEDYTFDRYYRVVVSCVAGISEHP